MNPKIIPQFRMKRAGKMPAVRHQNRLIPVMCKHRHGSAGIRDNRCPNENGPERDLIRKTQRYSFC